MRGCGCCPLLTQPGHGCSFWLLLGAFWRFQCLGHPTPYTWAPLWLKAVFPGVSTLSHTQKRESKQVFEAVGTSLQVPATSWHRARGQYWAHMKPAPGTPVWVVQPQIQMN